MPKNNEYVELKNFEKIIIIIIKSPSMIYADFECILAPESNRKENPNESYIKKY